MQSFIIALLVCSVTMSALALLFMASTPFLSKRYSEKGRYYAWLIIVFGLIIPFRPQLGGALVNIDVPASAPQYVIQMNGEAPSHVFPPTTFPTAPDAAASGTGINLSLWQIGFAVWLMGVIIFIAYHGIKHYHFAKTARRFSTSIANGQIMSLLQNLKAEMGITRRIPIYLCTFVGSPMMIGLIRPRILLPTVELAQDELRFILKHELVHYKRKDLLYKYSVLAATALHWFNPVVYQMAKAVNVLCEMSCDAAVLRNADMGTRQSYGETIIGVVQYQSKLKTALSTNFYGGKNSMKNRISSIMDIRKKRMGAAIVTLTLIATLCTGFAFAVSAYANTNNLTLTVNEVVSPNGVQRGANTLNAEEAAQAAGKHIMEIFNVCIDGSAVQMAFNGQWVATIAESSETMANNDWTFRVTLEAVDGELVSVQMNGRGHITQSGAVRPPGSFVPPAGAQYTRETTVEINGQRIVVPQENIVAPNSDGFSWFREMIQSRLGEPQRHEQWIGE